MRTNQQTQVSINRNDYLLRYEVLIPQNGIHTVGEYLIEWLPENHYGVNKEDIESNIKSFKRFYTHKVNGGYLEKDDMTELNQILNDEVRPWLAKFQE